MIYINLIFVALAAFMCGINFEQSDIAFSVGWAFVGAANFTAVNLHLMVTK